MPPADRWSSVIGMTRRSSRTKRAPTTTPTWSSTTPTAWTASTPSRHAQRAPWLQRVKITHCKTCLRRLVYSRRRPTLQLWPANLFAGNKCAIVKLLTWSKPLRFRARTKRATDGKLVVSPINSWGKDFRSLLTHSEEGLPLYQARTSFIDPKHLQDFGSLNEQYPKNL